MARARFLLVLLITHTILAPLVSVELTLSILSIMITYFLKTAHRLTDDSPGLWR